MKKILLFLLAITILTACQDEFCTEAVTPELVVRFYDKDSINESTKTIDLIVNVYELDSLFDGDSSIDSLYLPINTITNTVTYNLSILDSLDSDEALTINYTTEDQYVSKACGYKTVFKNFTIQATQNSWIDSIVQLKTEITDDNEAHIKIYH